MTRAQQHCISMYLNRLRSHAKREYAWAYWEWLCLGEEGEEPRAVVYDLSQMGAQAVRIDLYPLWKYLSPMVTQ